MDSKRAVSDHKLEEIATNFWNSEDFDISGSEVRMRTMRISILKAYQWGFRTDLRSYSVQSNKQNFFQSQLFKSNPRPNQSLFEAKYSWRKKLVIDQIAQTFRGNTELSNLNLNLSIPYAFLSTFLTAPWSKKLWPIRIRIYIYVSSPYA